MRVRTRWYDTESGVFDEREGRFGRFTRCMSFGDNPLLAHLQAQKKTFLLHEVTSWPTFVGASWQGGAETKILVAPEWCANRFRLGLRFPGLLEICQSPIRDYKLGNKLTATPRSSTPAATGIGDAYVKTATGKQKVNEILLNRLWLKNLTIGEGSGNNE